MKKSVFTIMLCLLSLINYAQNDDGRLVVEGKTWTIFHYPLDSKVLQYTYQMQIKGDTTINEVTYKKLYQDHTFIGVLREDGDKVYYNEVCLYDFGLNVGDSINDALGRKYLTVISKENKEYFGQERTTLALSYENKTSTEWIRGIGSLSRLDCNNILPGNCDCLVTCTVNNDTIYKDLWLYDIITNIAPAQISESNAAIYDILGRKLSVKPEKGFYIKNKKKFLVQ